MKKITLFLSCIAFAAALSAQATLIDSFSFEWTNIYNSFWGITDVNGQLHLGADGPGDIYVLDVNGQIEFSVDVADAIDFNHGMVWDGGRYWVAEDYTSSGASLFQLDPLGNMLSSFGLPPLITGNSSGVGGLSLDTDGGIWFSIYYPDLDEYPYSYAYKINPNTQEMMDTIPLYGQQVYGLAVHGDVVYYVTDDLDGDEEKIYAYSQTLGDTLFTFPLLDPDGDSSPRGLHWFDNHLWLLAKRPGPSAFAHSMLYKYAIEGSMQNSGVLSIPDETLDFGTVYVGTTADTCFYVYNLGDGNLDILSITSSNAVFAVAAAEVLPHSINPGDSLKVMVSFSPEESLNDLTEIEISSDAAENAVQNLVVSGFGDIMIATNNIERKVHFVIYPNPAHEVLTLEMTAFKEDQLHFGIHSTDGTLVKTGNILGKQTEIQVTDLPRGAYFVKILQSGRVLDVAPIVLK